VVQEALEEGEWWWWRGQWFSVAIAGMLGRQSWRRGTGVSGLLGVVCIEAIEIERVLVIREQVVSVVSGTMPSWIVAIATAAGGSLSADARFARQAWHDTCPSSLAWEVHVAVILVGGSRVGPLLPLLGCCA